MKRIRAVCVVLVLVLLLGLLAVGCKKPEQKSEYLLAVENYYAAIRDNDFSKWQKAMPSQVLDALGMNAADLSGENRTYSGRFGDGFTISVKEKGSRQLNEKQLGDLAEYLRRDYGITDKIKDAYLAEFDVTMAGSNDKQTVPHAHVVYQLGDAWYMDLWADSEVSSINALYYES